MISDRVGLRWSRTAAFLVTKWRFIETGGAQLRWPGRGRSVVSAKRKLNETERLTPERFYDSLTQPDVRQTSKRICKSTIQTF